MPSRIAFHACVHQAVAGPSPENILASIRAEYCLPRAALPQARRASQRAAVQPVLQLEDFAALARVLGRDAFRQLVADAQRQDAGLEDLPDFLARHRYGRATPALADLARLELALALSDRAPPVSSIGACCLPPDLLRAHPDLIIALHPAWRWLDLSVAADDWRDELLDGIEVPPVPAPRTTRLRLHPGRPPSALGQPAISRLSEIAFAFERALSQGASLHRAGIAVGGDQGRFDPIAHLHALLMAGAVIGVQMHPVPASPALQPHEVTT